MGRTIIFRLKQLVTPRSQKGNALLAVMTAAMVVSTAYMASLQTVKLQSAKAIAEHQNIEMDYYQRRVEGVLSESTICLENFPAGLNFSNGSTSAGETRNNLVKNGVVQITPGEKFGSNTMRVANLGGFKILDTQLEQPARTLAPNSTNEEVALIISADRIGQTGRALGSTRITRKVLLKVETDGGRNMISCATKTDEPPIQCQPIQRQAGNWPNYNIACPVGYRIMTGGFSVDRINDDAGFISKPQTVTYVDYITKATTTYDQWVCSTPSNKGYNAACYAVCCTF